MSSSVSPPPMVRRPPPPPPPPPSPPSSTRKSLLPLLVFALTAPTCCMIGRADDSSIQDFCVADPNSTISVNGLACKSASQVMAHDFASQLLRNPAPFQGKLGSAVNLASAANFPGLNTQGLSIARIDFLPRGVNPPHVHPRASELLFLVDGSLTVGFVTSNGTLVQHSIDSGDLFVFPRGLVHFQLNSDDSKPAIAISALDSQNPGVYQVVASLFAATPSLPPAVLQVTLGVEQATVDILTASVGATLC